ncbi:FecR family protein [Gammaproteobacteria bacterium]|nr:FecR family protein [Gammaproteobacteria bacterium]
MFIRILLTCISLFSASYALSENETYLGNSGEGADLRPVGSVSLVIGRAFSKSQTSPEFTRLSTGTLLYEGDLLKTESSGHIHLQLRDSGIVSLRPNSELQIEVFKFDEENPEASAVKFNLLKGTTRSVSGKAAESAKHRFRLNTPIAAIGVRGTDFVVSATSNSLMALVNQGEVVVAPFSAQCSAQGIGPCSFNAIELDDQAMQVIEFNSEMAIPQLVPIVALGPGNDLYETFSQDASLIAGGIQQAIEESDSAASSTNSLSANTEDAAVAEKQVVTETVSSLELEDEAKEQAPYSTGFTPIRQQTASELRKRQLVWGRFASGKGQLERLTLPFSEASEGRSISIGGNFEYFLFRPEEGEVQVQRGLGETGFSLSSAQAYFKKEGSVSPVAVTDGRLVVDFSINSFETSLDLYHLQLGEAQFSVAGGLYSGGYFHARDDNSRVVGATTLDGKESGYFFDFLNWGGLVQGITLWDAAPL